MVNRTYGYIWLTTKNRWFLVVFLPIPVETMVLVVNHS
jgi:hypothetical protein